MTGGSGYVAGWIIARLLDAGYAVRGTLRDTSRSAAIRADIATATKDLAALDFVRADLLADLGWDAAMQGVAAVMHVASPVMARRKEDTIGTAVEGTRRVLAAAARAGVDRVIITSSAAAARIGEAASGPADEQVWTDATAPHIGVYARSKTLAEQAAWEFARQHPDGPASPRSFRPLCKGRSSAAMPAQVSTLSAGCFKGNCRQFLVSVFPSLTCAIWLNFTSRSSMIPMVRANAGLQAPTSCGSPTSRPCSTTISERRRRRRRGGLRPIGCFVSSHSLMRT